ncbi:hypothetical protein IFM89_036034 [Coptis chinensis]|uniref:Uncharacterized protein n=1 Tax=Coptis chinensis TaxID=261450 RepID=A0A835LPP3_9MAGN|nr:hypothetical protein IFM89_036034 [Coptis chinensis]
MERSVAFVILLFICVSSISISTSRFVVEKNSLTLTSLDSIKGTHDSAIGNFGIPQYGGSMAGSVLFPKENQKGCKKFEDFGVSFKTKSGGLPNFILVDRGEEKPAILANSSDADNTVAHVDIFVKEEIQTPETENVTNAISFSADEETEREIKNGQPNSSDVAESEEKDSRNLHVPDASVNIDEGSSSRDMVKEPEVLEIQDKQKKEESPSIGELRDSGLNRNPEILPAVEPVQAPLSRRALDEPIRISL